MNTISVVIATYHRYEQLKNTIQDLLNQTVAAKQIIVVDNSEREARLRPDYLISTEDTECIYISSDGVGIVNKARNEGLYRVTSDYVLLLDDDMKLPNDCLEKFLEVHLEGWDAVKGLLFENGRFLQTYRSIYQPLWDVLKQKHGLTQCNTIAVSSGFISMRTKLVQEIGYLDEAFTYYLDDYDLGYRIWSGGYKLIHDPRVRGEHFQSASGGRRIVFTKNKYILNRYTAKYYFLCKHFSRQAVILEFINNLITVLWFNRFRPLKAIKHIIPITQAILRFRNYDKIDSV